MRESFTQLGARIFASREHANGRRAYRDDQLAARVAQRTLQVRLRTRRRGLCIRAVAVGLALDPRWRGDADGFANLRFDLGGGGGMLAQELARIVLPLPDLVAGVRIPGARFFDDPVIDAELDDLALAADALAVQDVEERLAKRRRHLVLDARFVADDFLAALDRADAANVEAHRRVELERIAAGGSFGIAEHHADLHPDLVDEYDQHVGAL